MISARNLFSKLYRGGLVAVNQATSYSFKQVGCSMSLCRWMSTGQLTSVSRQPILQVSPTISQCQVRTYKTKSVLKLRCNGCYYVEKFGRLYVECTKKPRHKQMQIKTGTSLYRDDYSKGKWHESIHWQWRQRQGFYQRGNTEYARVNWLKGRIGTEV